VSTVGVCGVARGVDDDGCVGTDGGNGADGGVGKEVVLVKTVVKALLVGTAASVAHTT